MGERAHTIQSERKWNFRDFQKKDEREDGWWWDNGNEVQNLE
jgi:hypothetical protein